MDSQLYKSLAGYRMSGAVYPEYKTNFKWRISDTKAIKITVGDKKLF